MWYVGKNIFELRIWNNFHILEQHAKKSSNTVETHILLRAFLKQKHQLQDVGGECSDALKLFRIINQSMFVYT